jgi:hypothetical protein
MKLKKKMSSIVRKKLKDGIKKKKRFDPIGQHSNL